MMRVSLVYLLLLFALVVEVNCVDDCVAPAKIVTQGYCASHCRD